MKEPFSVTLLNGREFSVPASGGSGLDQFDVAFFTASCDDPQTVTKYAAALKLDYPILSDAECQAAKQFGVVNAERTLPQRWTFYIGKDGKVLYIDKNVKPATHGKDIAQKLADLDVPQK